VDNLPSIRPPGCASMDRAEEAVKIPSVPEVCETFAEDQMGALGLDFPRPDHDPPVGDNRAGERSRRASLSRLQPRFPAAILRRSIVASYSFASTPSSSATSRSGRPDSVAFLTIAVALS